MKDADNKLSPKKPKPANKSANTTSTVITPENNDQYAFPRDTRNYS